MVPLRYSLGDCAASHCASAHLHAMRVVLGAVQLGWNRFLRANLAEFGVLVAHLHLTVVAEAMVEIVVTEPTR